MFLVLTYLVSAALEILGVWLVLSDLRADRAKARMLLMVGFGSHVDRGRQQIPRGDSDRDRRDRDRMLQTTLDDLRKLELRSRWVTDHLRKTVADMLAGGSTWKLVRGPALLTIGVIIGTAANIAAR